MSAINSAQPELAVVIPYVARRNPNQEAMANTAKLVSTVAVETTCDLASAAVQTASEAVCSFVPAEDREILVNNGLNVAREIIQEVANTCIDSNACYGSEDSCISKTTSWVKDQFQ